MDTDMDMDCKESGISTSGFFYPPLTPPATAATHEPLVPPPPRSPPPLPPHPYQTYAPGSYDYHSTTPTLTANSNSHTQLHPGRYPSAVSTYTTASSIDVDTDKASTVQPTYVIHHHHHHHHPPRSTSLPSPLPLPLSLPPPPRPAPSTPTRRLSPSALHKLRLLLLLLVFIPIPPSLSVLYLTIGHALLQRARATSHTLTSTPWSAPLLTSANAGATGGIILALPLFLLLFLLLYPSSPSPSPSSSSGSSSSSLFPSFASLFNSSTSSPTRTAHEDFFDDDDDDDSRTASSRRAASLVSSAACAFLVLGVGAAAGPLGVTCLSTATTTTTDGMGMGTGMLSPGRAAEAGVVGALVLWAGVLAVLALGVGGWVCWRVAVAVGRARRGQERGLGEGGHKA